VPTPPPTAPTLVVMAAGIGSRFGGLKQMASIGPGGESLIEYSLYDAVRAGFGSVVFVIHREFESLFRERIGRNVEPVIDTRYVYQELNDLPEGFTVPAGRAKPWGTGHAVLTARSAVSGPFAVINGDDFYGRQSLVAIADFLRSARDDSKCRYALVGYAVENTLSEHGTVARAVCATNSEGELTEITERTRIRARGDGAEYTEDGASFHPIPRGTRVSMNLWGFTVSMIHELCRRFPEFLRSMSDPQKSEYPLPAVVGMLIQERRASVRVLPCEDPWFGITYREDTVSVTEAIRRLVSSGTYPARLWRGRTLGPLEP
jgi:hypothetical protein